MGTSLPLPAALPAEPALPGYRGARGAILVELKREPGLTIRGLMRRLGLSANAVRHHLRELEAERLVEHDRARHGVGAPRHAFRLAAASWISDKTARELTETYWYLRAVENRLQMLRDEQTHIMPDTPEAVAVIGRLMGEADLATFEKTYRAALERVARYYAELFTEGETLGSGEGNLVFTGSDDDPGTLETLTAMGFADAPKAIAAAFRSGKLGLLDYYRLKNVQADTSMRAAIAGVGDEVAPAVTR